MQDQKKPKDLWLALAKKPLQFSGIVGSIIKLPTCFIKNSTLPFETPSDHHARTDNTIFNKTKTLLILILLKTDNIIKVRQITYLVQNF